MLTLLVTWPCKKQLTITLLVKKLKCTCLGALRHVFARYTGISQLEVCLNNRLPNLSHQSLGWPTTWDVQWFKPWARFLLMIGWYRSLSHGLLNNTPTQNKHGTSKKCGFVGNPEIPSLETPSFPGETMLNFGGVVPLQNCLVFHPPQKNNQKPMANHQGQPVLPKIPNLDRHIAATLCSISWFRNVFWVPPQKNWAWKS